MQAAVGQRHGEARLGLEEQVLDALRPPFAADDMGRGGERRVHVAARVARRREHVAVPGIDLRRAGLDRLRRVEHRGQRLVFDVDERRGLSGERGRFGGHRREHVADIARLLALGDEDGPVGVDLPDPAVARDIGRGRNRGDAWRRAAP